MKLLLSVILVFYISNSFCQVYIKSNEEIIFTFKTNGKKQVYLIKDRTNKYICYRYGSKDKIDFEFPAINKESWNQFTYSFYLRGGGISNAGMDLNYIYFKNKGYKYIIYDTYYATGNEMKVGVRVLDIKTDKLIVDIKGQPKTRKGSLVDFRDSNLLKIGDELFD